MILSGAIMSYQNHFYKHPHELSMENIYSTFVRSSIIANHVNLSPVTLWSYNQNQVKKLHHFIFGTNQRLPNNHSIFEENNCIYPSHAIDLLSFIPDLMGQTFELQCNYLQTNQFDPAITHCPVPKV